MSRYIEADNLYKVKYHNLPYTHIVPSDENAESYKRGWNDAIDAIIENEPTADVIPACEGGPSPYKKPIANKYIHAIDNGCEMLECPECGYRIIADWFSYAVGSKGYAFCPYCGANLRKEDE